jgi:cell division protein FtsL
MNAAAREINQTNLFKGNLTELRLSKSLCLQIILLLMVLVSAVAVVYVTNLHRLTFSQLEVVEQQKNELDMQWGQLLLEQASLVTPSRVQELAAEKLKMVLPDSKQMITLRAQ